MPIPKLAALIACAVTLSAAEPVKPEAAKPKPLDEKRVAEGAVLQSKMHAAQRNNLAIEADIRQQAAELPAVRQSREQLKLAQAAYDAFLAKARQEAGAAPGCALDLDLKWECPPEPKKEAAKKQ